MNTRSAGAPRILIVGAGFGGLCLGIQLRQAGIESFTILEKARGLGGTWRDNTYPGAACDSPSFGYCFSFEQKTDWTRKWAGQAEILAYMEHCARKYGLAPHLRFATEVTGARFDEAAGVWRVSTAGGDELEAEVLVSCVGQLNRPRIPEIRGRESFRGEAFHSARWNHAYDLSGKRVAVVGNAASAIQFVPEIAPRAGRLFVFQRSANWMMPKRDREFSPKTRERFTRHPWLARLYRWWIWASFDVRYPLLFHAGSPLGKRFQRMAEREMRKIVKDPVLQEALVPDYPVGGKRILISDDYYRAIQRENVEVVTSPIERITASSIVSRDGTEREVDAIIWATGFESTDFLAPMEIRGLAGRRLGDEWKDGARAYLGLSVPGFPNFFMTYGPNTNLGHNSILFMIECQVHYILECLELLRVRGLAWLDLRPEALERWDAEIQRELSETVWARTARSWYKNEAGRITNNWSGTTTRYWWRTRRVDPSLYRQQSRSALSEAPAAAREVRARAAS